MSLYRLVLNSAGSVLAVFIHGGGCPSNGVKIVIIRGVNNGVGRLTAVNITCGRSGIRGLIGRTGR